MHKIFAAALALAASASFAAADSAISTKAMQDLPGTMGGSTVTPTSPSEDGNLTTKAMHDQPGTMGGNTQHPAAKGDAGSLSDTVMKQNAN